jgi:hypothetical protein
MLRKTFRLKMEDVYDMKLISPTSAEKLAKAPKATKKNPTPQAPKLKPVQWAKLQALISRSNPVPSVKPTELIREPYSVTQPDAGGFDVVPDEDQLW